MVIFCIGSPEISGDSVAPLVGDILIERNINAFVYGTTARPISGSNYEIYYDFVHKTHPNQAIIAIDASLGKVADVGMIKVVSGGIHPGKAVGRNLSSIGDVGILAQVGEKNSTPLCELMSVPYKTAISMAKRCADIVESWLQ